MKKNRIILMNALLIAAGSFALNGCSQAPVAQADKTSSPQVVAVANAKLFQSQFDYSLLAHRESGAVNPSGFEAQVRTSVRNHLNVDFSALAAQVETENGKQQLLQKLAQLDAKLSDFKHASNQGSEFEQLWALIPVLPTLEERKALKIVLAEELAKASPMANEQMAYLMDLQLNRLFNGFSVSLDALTPETQVFENDLLANLKSHGLNISAKRPSLILQYFVELMAEDNQTLLIGDFELKDRDSKIFKAFNEEMSFEHGANKVSQNQIFAQLSQKISALMLQEAMARIQTVNAAQH